MKYRKKPVVIEAVRITGIPQVMPEWWTRAVMSEKVLPTADGGAIIRTLEGDMTADPGDWIIQGVKGELYPCKPDIFEATYEEVKDGGP